MRLLQWKAVFIFRGKSRHLLFPGSLSEKEVARQASMIARERRWRLLKIEKGLY